MRNRQPCLKPVSAMSEESSPAGFRVAGIGEVLWDLLTAGAQLGGAPANFAFHAQSLGARSQVVSRVGDDAGGREIIRRFGEMGLCGGDLQVDPEAPTGTVAVELSGEGIPQFTIHENVAWDRIESTPEALARVRECDAVCFGSLAQRGETSRRSIQQLVAAVPEGAWRIFDINLRQRFFSREVVESSLHLANVLKLNDGELPVLAGMFGAEGSPERQIPMLAERFGLAVVALTRGAEGSLLYRGGRWSRCGSRPVEVKDTVGAGDSFTAALAMGLLLEMDLDEIHRAAGEVARHVCSCHGATPPLPDALRRMFTRTK